MELKQVLLAFLIAFCLFHDSFGFQIRRRGFRLSAASLRRRGSPSNAEVVDSEVPWRSSLTDEPFDPPVSFLNVNYQPQQALRAPQQDPPKAKSKQETRLETAAQLAPYCEHTLPNTAWLICRKKEDGSYDFESGNNGVAIFGWIRNDGHQGIRVYRNSPLGPKSATDFLFRTASRIQPSQRPLPAVIKLTFQSSESNSRALEAESRNTRIVTPRRFDGGTPIVPDLYDLQLISTGETHPIHKLAIPQQRVEGDTIVKVFKEMIDSERNSLTDNLENFLTKFGAYFEARSAPAGSPQPKSIQELRNAVVHAIRRGEKEIWRRVRLRLTLVSLIYEAARQMWATNTLHCDSHIANIMLLRQRIRNPAEFLSIKQSGKGFIPRMRIYLTESLVPSPPESRWLASPSGIPVYYFDVAHIRWIDAARALDLQPIYREVEQSIGPAGNAKASLNAPCIIYRSTMPDDIVELWRSGVEYVLGGSGHKPGDLYAKVLQEFPKQSANPTATHWFRQYSELREPHAPEKRKPGSQPMQSSLAAMDVLFDGLDSMQRTISRVDKLLTDLHTQTLNLPAYQACHRARTVAFDDANRQTFANILAKPQPWARITTLVGEGCTMQAMVAAVETIQSNLKQAVLSAQNDIGPAILFGR